MSGLTDRPTKAASAAPGREDVVVDVARLEGQSMAEYRARVLTQVQALAADGDVLRGFPVGLGGADDYGGSLAQFEELVVADPSLQIKAGVQWGLFAG
jgi:acyl-CoA oxidase